MKLTLKKKFGWTHVRGGDLVRVAIEHAVPTRTRTELQTEYARPRTKEGWVYCAKGDLALEIVAVKTGQVLGHSYLSGPAIQLHRYSTPQSDWFEGATLEGVTLPVPAEDDDPEGFMPRFIGAMMDLKYGPLDVVGFKGTAKSMDDAKKAMEFFQYAWSGAPQVEEPPEATTHFIGVIEVDGGGAMVIHFQPKKHADDLAASHFQAGLVVSAKPGGR